MKKSKPIARDAHERPSLKQMRRLLADRKGLPSYVVDAMTASKVREAYANMLQYGVRYP